MMVFMVISYVTSLWSALGGPLFLSPRPFRRHRRTADEADPPTIDASGRHEID
jgi:hypothetical protein